MAVNMKTLWLVIEKVMFDRIIVSRTRLAACHVKFRLASISLFIKQKLIIRPITYLVVINNE